MHVTLPGKQTLFVMKSGSFVGGGRGAPMKALIVLPLIDGMPLLQIDNHLLAKLNMFSYFLGFFLSSGGGASTIAFLVCLSVKKI